ncbi:ubiquinone-dependent pyruvate dehydrogenase [Nocardioides bruguierae]|uniref:Pyruvate dehydrogenase [ubiquinone] n=1 Tax=Nocardioides bruguierae TaxID=2945102 RepID=A0A9X2IGK3_9ACTN|nr:ubiquinone-dependent pyruvate dehydrogenase [Nocardioides bruguierae]MCM0620875.1 ubiquinone-dependent pyruvate dehydrogenase [Nocardioides bruguierae]
MTTVAQNIVDTLEANGVTRVYGVPGDSLNGFTDALRGSGIRWMHTRHEEAAAFAASAEAATTGNIAVCAGSCGPGNLHLINGLYDANRSRVPVVAIAAHIPTAEIGTNYFQETHPQDLFRECSVYSEYVASPAQMPRLLRIAMQTAVEKQGVAVLVVPGDVALAEAADTTVSTITTTRPRVVPQDDQLAEAARLLDAGKRVTILAGAGCADAHDEVVALADTLGAPVVHALRGKEHLEHDNPFDVGLTGLLGFSSGYKAMEESDTLLMLGTDFPYTQFFPEHARTIQVDIRGEQLGRRTTIDLGIVGDVAETARGLLSRLTRKTDRGHLEDALAHYRKTRAQLDDLASPTKPGRKIHPQYLTRVIDTHASDDAVFIPDVGSPVTWASRYLTMNGRRRLIGSFSHGTMANALPQAIGVAASHPGRQVVALAGDGGLAMLMGELLTLKQLDLDVTVVVYNNSSLNFVELEMKAAGFVNFATELDNPDFAQVARAIGLHGVRVEESEDVEAAVKEALAHRGPSLIDVVTDRQEMSMPPTVTAEQVKGFTLYALRTVMSGRGDEIIDLARTNLRQLF